MLHAGLRVRITATIAGIVVVAVAALTLAVHFLVVQNRIDQQRQSAADQLNAAVEIYRETGLLSFDARLNDPALPAELRGALVRDDARGTYLSGRGTRQVWAAARVGDDLLSLHGSFRTVDESVAAVDRALLLAGVATALIAILVGALSAGGLSRRLRLAARTARTIADRATSESPPDPVTPAERAGDRSLRQAVGPGRDEVGDLADAVDVMAARLADRVRAEQRFTADVAHDLRTPLTGLTASAALLDDSRPAQLVRERVATLANLVEELLEIARLDSGLETAQLEYARLGDVVQRAVQRGVAKGEISAAHVSVVVVDPEATVLTDARRVERVLTNLVRNALRHGAPPVQIEVGSDRIVVSDHGPGFSDELLREGPRRFRRDSASRGDGHGLGLIIAVGQAEVLGGRLAFSNAASGGARVTVHLPHTPPRAEETEPSPEPGGEEGTPGRWSTVSNTRE